VSQVEFGSVLINEDEQIRRSVVLQEAATDGRQLRTDAELEMCDRCARLDKKIAQYQRISFSLNDQLTVDRIKALIAELEAQKAALHPERQK
jgi:hypothetical protein